MNCYTGIGSRETPEAVLALFIQLGRWLANKHYTLRSGHAPGADSAFETGCSAASGTAEIYLPWPNFNGSASQYVLNTHDNAAIIAKQFHPAWNRLSPGAQKLQARNSYQILGYDLQTPTNFVICWTKDGTGQGGTGQALRIAKAHNIPIFDFGKYTDLEKAKTAFNEFYLINKNKGV